jgi:glycosyltransferase involved in cell wall biosynthesis
MTGVKRLAVLLPDMRGGGAERVGLRLINDFLAAGHEVDLVLLEEKGELLELLPPEVKVFGMNAPRVRSAIEPLARYFRERNPHAVQISMWPYTIAGLLAHRWAGSTSRVVLSDHATLSKHYRPGTIAYFLLTKTVRLFYPWADARVIVAEHAADDLARISGIDRASIEVIYNPVSAPPPDQGERPDIEALWGNAEKRIITVGTLKDQKNHKLLIRSFARAFSGSSVKLMILGEGPLRSDLEALVDAEGLSDRVIMPGFTTEPWPYYASADLFALSSDYEGYPLVLIEAMRCGLSIVSTDCESGPREILEGGRYGILVPIRDEPALAKGLERGLRAANDPAALIRRAETLSGQATSDRYLQLMLGPPVPA